MRIVTTQLNTTTFRVGFTTVLGKRYAVERTTDSMQGWHTVADNIPGTGAMVQVTDTLNGSNGLYRVRLLR